MLHCVIWVAVIGAGLITAAGFGALTFHHYSPDLEAIARRLNLVEAIARRLK